MCASKKLFPGLASHRPGVDRGLVYPCSAYLSAYPQGTLNPMSRCAKTPFSSRSRQSQARVCGLVRGCHRREGQQQRHRHGPEPGGGTGAVSRGESAGGGSSQLSGSPRTLQSAAHSQPMVSPSDRFSKFGSLWVSKRQVVQGEKGGGVGYNHHGAVMESLSCLADSFETCSGRCGIPYAHVSSPTPVHMSMEHSSFSSWCCSLPL